jgi:uncharacterized protein
MNDDSSHEALPPYVRTLQQAEAYPHPPDSIEFIQTHISYVFLADDVVYKAKKAVSLGFIDQVTLASRERYCHAEVTLNRRLAPDVYLGVVPIVEFPDGRIAVEPEDAAHGEVIEWAVKMRRLPDDRTLDRLIEADQVPDDIAERLVAKLVPFHQQAEHVANDPSFAGAEAMRAWWKREYEESAGFIGDTWRPEDAAAMRRFADGWLDRHAVLFDERLAQGRVVEGHGDLRSKHVYVMGERDENLLIVDCVEFTDWFNFRYLDAGYDLAFLAMDLEARGRPELADELVGRYLSATADETLGLLQPLHRAFRAFVRGKVGSMGAHEPEVPAAQQREMAKSAGRYFALASTYAKRQTAPVLVVMTGLSGTGKSAIGATVAARAGMAYVSSDAVRKELHNVDVHEHRGAEFGQGLYQPEITERVYVEMQRRAAEHLALGHPVLLDATHSKRAQRQAAVDVAREAGVRCLIVDLQLSREVALQRIAARRSDPLATSDATEEIYEQQVASFEPITDGEGDLLALDAAEPIPALAREITDALPLRE